MNNKRSELLNIVFHSNSFCVLDLEDTLIIHLKSGPGCWCHLLKTSHTDNIIRLFKMFDKVEIHQYFKEIKISEMKSDEDMEYKCYLRCLKFPELNNIHYYNNGIKY